LSIVIGGAAKLSSKAKGMPAQDHRIASGDRIVFFGDEDLLTAAAIDGQPRNRDARNDGTATIGSQRGAGSRGPAGKRKIERDSRRAGETGISKIRETEIQNVG